MFFEFFSKDVHYGTLKKSFSNKVVFPQPFVVNILLKERFFGSLQSNMFDCMKINVKKVFINQKRDL